MRCPCCKSTITAHDAVADATNEIYKCPICSARVAPNFDWKLLILLGLAVAPLVDGLLQFALQNLGGDALASTVGSKDASTVISMVATTVIIIAAYSYLRRPRVIETDATK
jgi:hypothetical protein